MTRVGSHATSDHAADALVIGDAARSCAHWSRLERILVHLSEVWATRLQAELGHANDVGQCVARAIDDGERGVR